MKKSQFSSKDLLLALLYCPGTTSKSNEHVTGRTRLVKMIFLFEKEMYKLFFSNLVIDLPKFEPYYYGPFSNQILEDLRFFESIGFIEKEETQIPISSAEKYEWQIEGEEDEGEDEIFKEDAVEMKYCLSKKGMKFVEEKIWNEFSSEQKTNLINFKTKINTISLDSLLSYVYNKYPKDIEKSLIADKYVKV
jgi:hypothetical protein